MELSGATILVTGAGRRIGRAIALCLAEGGAHVVLHMHSSTAEALVEDIEKVGGRASVIRADLGVPGEAERLARDVLQQVGVIDVLVNSAAVFFPTPIVTLSVDEWRKVMRVNMTSPLTLAAVLGREMKRRGEGKIIQLGDWSGQR